MQAVHVVIAISLEMLFMLAVMLGTGMPVAFLTVFFFFFLLHSGNKFIGKPFKLPSSSRVCRLSGGDPPPISLVVYSIYFKGALCSSL